MWINGRQGGDYSKKLLFQFEIGKFGMDCYLIKFAPLVWLKPHTDKVDGKHLRLNYVYKGMGSFHCEKKILDWKRLKIFRPDLYIHSMKNDNQERRVFSIGLKY